MFSLAIILLVLTAVVGSGALYGVIFWLTSRIRRLESSRESSEAGQLSSTVEALAAELSAVRDQLDMLEQRTDFNERLLEGRSTIPPAAIEE